MNRMATYAKVVHEHDPLLEQAPPPRRGIVWLLCMTFLILSRIVVSVGSRVAYKAMLGPSAPFTYLLGVWASLLYCLFYGVILILAMMFGASGPLWPRTRGMPTSKFIVMGAGDSLACSLGLMSGAWLSGPLIVILGQFIVPLVMMTSWFTVGEKYTKAQILSTITIMFGIGMVAIPSYTASPMHQLYTGLAIIGLVTSAVSFGAKEQILSQHHEVSILVVNFYGSVWQLVFSFLLLPLVSLPQLGGLPMEVLPDYVRLGWQCLSGSVGEIELLQPQWLEVDGAAVQMGAWSQCADATQPILIYCALSLLFSLVMLLLMKRVSAEVNFIAGTTALTLQYFAFARDWPMLPSVRVELSRVDYTGIATVVLGLLLYRASVVKKQSADEWKRLQQKSQQQQQQQQAAGYD
mmetsp:Transcript_24536/g.44495  ORF Transcript_24536/g.44495 Transcript_24536/m.44495 type:complete len:407 (-) Transcript_24536:169-1389(-)